MILCRAAAAAAVTRAPRSPAARVRTDDMANLLALLRALNVRRVRVCTDAQTDPQFRGRHSTRCLSFAAAAAAAAASSVDKMPLIATDGLMPSPYLPRHFLGDGYNKTSASVRCRRRCIRLDSTCAPWRSPL